MVLAEVFIGAFITVLFEKLASSDLWNLARSEEIDSQLEKWRITLTQIRAVLIDAEQKQVTNEGVHDWLHHLQVLAYDIDDVLDDLATEALRRKLIIESEASTSTSTSTSTRSKVWKFIPTCCTSFTPRNFMYGREISSKLDDITDRLEHLLRIKNGLGLSVNVEVPVNVSRREETTSLVDASEVFGRDGDKEKLLEKLLQEETCDRNVSVVPIVGMGGIGKTTLAKLLYNDDKVKDHFELRAWVCVSDEFDIFKISKIIFQAVAGENRDFANLDLLQVALQEKLSKKKFLLVLDDVWNEKMGVWEQLQRPFNVGGPGSKIIVTTRSLKVVSTVRGVQAYHLQLLSVGESLSLLAQHALGKENFDAHPKLESYGMGIVSKCECLPLALIVLGRVLSTKSNEAEWEELLNSDIWSSEEEKSEILPALRLSYHHLPPHLKQLFAYCSLFPKDYVFEKDELVLLWMAEGFLPSSKEEKPMEDVGAQYFEELLYRSFFQHSPNDESRYIMHDLINDLAKYVAGKFFLRLDEKANGVEGNEALEKFRYLSFLRQYYEVYRKFEAFCRAKHLRTFLAVSVNLGYWDSFYLSNMVLVDLLPQLQCLRVLSLSRYCSIRDVPDSICDLKHLRYLNFSRTGITCLPEQVCQLYNLQTLLMHGCKELEKLPVSFAKLINLRHLDISDTPKLKKMPLGIGGLTSLRTLSKFIVEEDDGFKITELKGLMALRGRLSIKGLHKVVNEHDHAKEANLLQKKGLEHLELEWSNEFDDSHTEATEYGVLEVLRPHSNLRKLEIVGYGGNKFPNWIGDPSFVGLTELTLRGCKNCTSLPSVGHLPSLRKLSVRGMDAVKTVGPEILGTSNSSPVIVFPSLEVLEFINMQGWEKWSINGGVNPVFPRLRKLIIADCLNLGEVSIQSLPSLGDNSVFPLLRDLSIERCHNLGEVSIQSLPSLGVLCIDGCQEVVLRSVVEVTSCVTKLKIENVVGLTQVKGGMIERLGALEDLYIGRCNEVRYLWGSLAEACRILVKLRKLVVSSCGELVCLGEREKEEGGNWREENYLTSLRELEVRSCPKMECLFVKGIEEEEESLSSSIFPHLESLYISSCSGMKSLFSTGVGGGGQQLPSTLKRLRIEYCENLLLLEESVVGLGVGGETHSSTLSSSSSLDYLNIESWPNTKLFLERGGREGRFIHLTELKIYDCESIDSFPKMTTTTGGGRGGGFLPKGLRTLRISRCKNLKWFPDEELQSLTSLVDLTIRNCPSMDLAFPRGLWPPNLSSLWISGLKKPISEWGPQKFPTSLVDLSLIEDESIVEVVVGSSGSSTSTTATTTLHLPTTLSRLELSGFKKLESISKGLQHLTSLETLQISGCPNLRYLPETLLPSIQKLSTLLCLQCCYETMHEIRPAS